MPVFRNSPDLEAPVFPGSHMVCDDRYAFLSGLVAPDLPGHEGILGDAGAEARLVMDCVLGLLEHAGCGIGDVVRVDMHLADLADAAAVDAVYGAYFPAGRFPARTCVQVGRLFGDARVEITCMARLPEPVSPVRQ
jgi:2-iminobutanoate/2-iminopropanoate deaminase